ncbi:hypothetical protein cypCar_00042533 [Cyprinus carpio]|nr:hypothetical protein cypCar_00042533 [Cyprinus carpio]
MENSGLLTDPARKRTASRLPLSLSFFDIVFSPSRVADETPRWLKAAEECFRQVKEKATYSVKPKHASGIKAKLGMKI